MDTGKPPNADHLAAQRAFCVNKETRPFEGVDDAQSGHPSWRTLTAKGVPLKIARGVAVFIPGNTEHGVEAGAAGLSILYGFAHGAFF